MTKSKMKNKKNVLSRRKTNPIYRTQPRVSRPRLAFNGQYLEAFTYLPSITSASDGTAFNAYTIDCASNGVAGSQYIMTGFYKEYVFESLKCEWIPSVAPGQVLGGSQIYISSTSNPEQMVTYGGAITTVALTDMLLDPTTKIFNAWERVTVNIPIPRRRKQFDVNTTNALTVDVFDRSTQGLLLLGYNTSVISSSVGRWKVSYVIKLMGLSNVAT